MYQEFAYYINNVVLGPRSMWWIEVILAVLLVFTYIIVAKWTLSTVLSWLFSINRYNVDWFSYVIVVILTPITLNYYFHYEITPLSIAVFISYSACWLWSKAYKRAFFLF